MRDQSKLLGQNRAPCRGQHLPKESGDHCQSRWASRRPQPPKPHVPASVLFYVGSLDPRLASDHVTGKRQTELLIGSEGRAMIGGSDKCAKGLSGLVAAFSAWEGGSERFLTWGIFQVQMPGALSSWCSLLCRLPVTYASLSIFGNQIPLRRTIQPPSTAVPAVSAAPAPRFPMGCCGVGTEPGFPALLSSPGGRRPLAVLRGNAWRSCGVGAVLGFLTPETQSLLN